MSTLSTLLSTTILLTATAVRCGYWVVRTSGATGRVRTDAAGQGEELRAQGCWIVRGA